MLFGIVVLIMIIMYHLFMVLVIEPWRLMVIMGLGIILVLIPLLVLYQLLIMQVTYKLFGIVVIIMIIMYHLFIVLVIEH